MKNVPSIRLIAAFVVAVSVLLGVAAVNASGPPQVAQNAIPQPDTKSSDWKAISDDVGIWVGKSDYTGLRGRLFVRQGDIWMPVAIDGAADIRSLFPAGK
jgi:hypothetical protein